MTERGPAPIHMKNQAKFPALDSSTLVGLEQQASLQPTVTGWTPASLIHCLHREAGLERTPGFIASWLAKGTALPCWADRPFNNLLCEYLANICCW